MTLFTHTSRVLIALLGLVAGACSSSQDEMQSQSVIEAWLSCEECTNGERAAVTALGDDAVDALDGALGVPTQTQTANINSQILQGLRLADSGATLVSPVAARFRENFVAARQQRAAMALGDIGSPKAIAALRRALAAAEARRYRPDVIRVIEATLVAGEFRRFHGVVAVDTSAPGGPGGGGRGSGLGTPNIAGFGDTVQIYRDSARAWNGNETVTLRGGPFPTEVFVDRLGDSILRFRAIADPGAYTIELGGLGPSDTETQTAPLRVTSASPPLGPASGGARTVSPAGDTVFLRLGRTPADTIVDHDIRVTAERSVRAAVESRAYETASVRWLSCEGDVLNLGDTVRGIVIDHRRAAVSGARVQALPSGPSAMTTRVGFFSLPLPPAPGPRTVIVKVEAAGLRTLWHRIQPSPDTIRIGLVRADVPETIDTSRFASTHLVPAGECRRIQVGIPTGGKPRIVKLIVDSP